MFRGGEEEGLTAGGGALVCLTVLGGRAEELAGSAESARGGLEVFKDVLDEGGLRGGAVGAAHEVAAEDGRVGPADLEPPARRDDRVLLGLHRLMEEGRVGGGHVLHRGHDWGELWVVFWDIATWGFGLVSIWSVVCTCDGVLTRTGAHVAVFRLPTLEPVGAGRAEGSVGSNLVEIEFDDKRVKVVHDVGAARDRAGQVVFAGSGIVDPNCTIVLWFGEVRGGREVTEEGK